MSNFTTIIEKALKEGKIISIYDEQNNSNVFSAGIVKGFTKEEIIIKKLNKEGKFDGTMIMKINNIVRIQYDGVYEKKLQILSTLKIENEIKEIEFDFNKHPILEILKTAKKYNKIVNIVIDEDANEIIGYVNSIEGDFLEINTITIDGFSDGITIFKISNIQRIDFDTIFDRYLGIVNKIIKQ